MLHLRCLCSSTPECLTWNGYHHRPNPCSQTIHSSSMPVEDRGVPLPLHHRDPTPHTTIGTVAVRCETGRVALACGLETSEEAGAGVVTIAIGITAVQGPLLATVILWTLSTTISTRFPRPRCI